MRPARVLDHIGAVFVLCLLLILLGLYLRIQALGFPAGLTWDEHHFVENARNYLAGRPDWNDHPPLGKLLMAWTMQALGDQAFAFRLPSLVMGIGSILVGARIAMTLFPFAMVGPITAAVLSVDGFLIAYSRTALLDGMLTFFVLTSFYLALRASSFWTMAAASLVATLALSTKTSGLLALLPILYFCFERRRPLWLLSLALVPLVFYAQWAYGLYLTGKPYDPASVWTVQANLMRHHAGLTEMKHPLTSRWYTWLLPTRTLPMRGDAVPGGMMVRVMNSLGHPLLWWTESALVIVCTLRLLLRGLVAELTPSSDDPTHRFFTQHRSIALLLLMWWLFMSPWILTRRDSYIYHYLPSYTFGLILSAAALAWLCNAKRRLGIAVLIAIAAVALFYAPVWGQLPLRPESVRLRLFMPGWR